MARLSIEVSEDEHKLIKMIATANQTSIKEIVMGSVVKLYPDVSNQKNAGKSIYSKMEDVFKKLKAS